MLMAILMGIGVVTMAVGVAIAAVTATVADTAMEFAVERWSVAAERLFAAVGPFAEAVDAGKLLEGVAYSQ
jgi:hypothetical protein